MENTERDISQTKDINQMVRLLNESAEKGEKRDWRIFVVSLLTLIVAFITLICTILF